MKFLVFKTSDVFGFEKPCEEAMREIIYTKHNNGNITSREHWVITFDTLKEFENFIDKSGGIKIIPIDFVTADDNNNIKYIISICDTSIE